MLEKAVEGLLFRSRWLMAPFYVGLIVALLVLLFKFGLTILSGTPWRPLPGDRLKVGFEA